MKAPVFEACGEGDGLSDVKTLGGKNRSATDYADYPDSFSGSRVIFLK